MYNSLIKYKPCKHPGCKLPPKIGAAGFCGDHRQDGIVPDEKKSWYNKNRNPAPALPEPVLKKLYQPKELQQWFLDAATQLAQAPFCQNCDQEINLAFLGTACGHILPKRVRHGFPSVAAHPLNRIFLGTACGCHQRFDNSWEQAAMMKLWPLVLEAFIQIYPCIAPAELKNLPELLLKQIPCNTNTPS